MISKCSIVKQTELYATVQGGFYVFLSAVYWVGGCYLPVNFCFSSVIVVCIMLPHEEPETCVACASVVCTSAHLTDCLGILGN